MNFLKSVSIKSEVLYTFIYDTQAKPSVGPVLR